jgi:endonuclease III
MAAGDVGAPASVLRKVAGVVDARTVLARGADTSTAAIVDTHANRASERVLCAERAPLPGLKETPRPIECPLLRLALSQIPIL